MNLQTDRWETRGGRALGWTRRGGGKRHVGGGAESEWTKRASWGVRLLRARHPQVPHRVGPPSLQQAGFGPIARPAQHGLFLLWPEAQFSQSVQKTHRLRAGGEPTGSLGRLEGALHRPPPTLPLRTRGSTLRNSWKCVPRSPQQENRTEHGCSCQVSSE